MTKSPRQDGGERPGSGRRGFPYWGLAAVLLGMAVLAVVFTFRGKDEKQGPIPAEALSRLNQEKAKAQKEFSDFIETPAGKLWQKHPYWDPAVCQKIAEGRVFTGMSKEQVKEAVARIEKIVPKNQKSLETWAAEGKGNEKWVLRFEENTLVSVENR